MILKGWERMGVRQAPQALTPGELVAPNAKEKK